MGAAGTAKAFFNVAGEVGTDLATETAMGSAQTGELVKPQIVTAIENKNERKIVRETISIVANVAAALVTGPAAIVILIASGVGMLLDAFWNPLQTYFNDDLKTFKKLYEDSLISMMRSEGYNWPLEVKPVVFPTTPEEEEEYQSYINKYYTDRGIISKQDALNYIDFINSMNEMNRISSVMFLSPDGSVDKEALMSTFSYLDTGKNIQEKKLLIDVAKALAKKRTQKKVREILLNRQRQKENSFIEFSKKNWQLYIVILICISLIIFSCSIIITSLTVSNE
jgi:hypothetical protein